MKSDRVIINTIRSRVMFDDLEGALEKSLMRQSQGSRTAAYKIIRECMTHYGCTHDEVKDFHIDCALGELNGGVEFEWPHD